MLDALEDELRIVRLRPGLIFKREAAPEIRRLFAGPLLPGSLLGRVPVLPLPDRLVFQCVHTADVAEAYRLAVTDDGARGAYNIAADPVIDPPTLARVLGARLVKVPERPLRLGADLTYRARLQPAPPGWVDMGLAVPTMSTARAREQLGWAPTRTAPDALRELLDGLRHPTGGPTPTLAPQAGGLARVKEFTTGVGGRLR
jgi:nucleoside-diphosphate-sugar epimerase